MKNSRGTSDRLLPYLAAIGVLFLLAYGFYAHTFFRQSLEEQFQTHQQAIANGVARGIEGMVRRLTNSMQSMAASPRILDMESAECEDRIQEFYFENQDIVFAGYRMDSRGRLRVMFPIDEKALGADISFQEHVKKLFKRKELVVSGLFKAVEGFDAIAVHAPVFRDGRIDGSVATVVRMSKIAEAYVGRVKLSNTGYAWLVDENGTILYHPDRNFFGAHIMESDLFSAESRASLFELIKAGHETTARIDGTLFAIAPFNMGNRKWTVVLSTPYSDIAGPVNLHSRNMWFIEIAVIILILFATYNGIRASVRAEQLGREKQLLEDKVGLQEELRASRDQLDTIIKTVPSGIYTLNARGEILTWNRMAERLTGYTAGEITGRHFKTLCGDKHCSGCDRLFDRASQPVSGRECTFTKKDGEEIIVSKNTDYVRNAAGEITGCIESFVDVTEAKKTEEKRITAMALEKEVEHLKKMDEVKSNFLSMVSHELRTPLSVILGNLSMARRNAYGDMPEKFQKKLDIMLRRGWQLNDLIANLLDLAKIDSGRVELKRQEISLEEKVAEVITELEENINSKKLRVSVDIPSGAATVLADPQMFIRLLTNLLDNAVKFTPDEGEISISSSSGERGVHITIKDSGIGIPESAMEHVFDRFFQADTSSTRKFGGTGLGLSIVKEIVDVHSGVIDIRSEENKGTAITVFMPHIKPGQDPYIIKHSDSPGDEKILPCPYFKGPMTMLYIGVDPDFLTDLVEFFEGTAHKVLSAQSARMAAGVIDREEIHFILVDLENFALDDFEMTVWKQLHREQLNVPVFVISASSEESAMRSAAAIGAVSIVVKPFDREQFIETVNNYIS